MTDANGGSMDKRLPRETHAPNHIIVAQCHLVVQFANRSESYI